MNKYEYCLIIGVYSAFIGGVFYISPTGEKVKLYPRPDANTYDKESLALNRLGKDGWEVCGNNSVIGAGAKVSERIWTLKRELSKD